MIKDGEFGQRLMGESLETGLVGFMLKRDIARADTEAHGWGTKELDWHLVKERALSPFHCCLSIFVLRSQVGTWIGLVLARTLWCFLRNWPPQTSNPAILCFLFTDNFRPAYPKPNLSTVSLSPFLPLSSLFFWSFKLKTWKSSLTASFPSSINFTSKFCSFVFMGSDRISAVTVLSLSYLAKGGLDLLSLTSVRLTWNRSASGLIFLSQFNSLPPPVAAYLLLQETLNLMTLAFCFQRPGVSCSCRVLDILTLNACAWPKFLKHRVKGYVLLLNFS